MCIMSLCLELREINKTEEKKNNRKKRTGTKIERENDRRKEEVTRNEWKQNADEDDIVHFRSSSHRALVSSVYSGDFTQ